MKAAMLARRQRFIEGAAGVDQRADEQVVEELVVVERRRRKRLPALPAADEMGEAVDLAEALAERLGPADRRVLVEQVDDLRVKAVLTDVELSGEGIELARVAVG
jgi:hypothetical protein